MATLTAAIDALPPETPAKGERRLGPVHQLWSIQYLRAVAAAAVIVFHLLQGLPLMWLGEHGVDLFFVISGLMMVMMTADRDVTAGRFLIDRVTRLVPLYWLATLFAVSIVWAGGRLFAVSTDPGLLIRSLLFVPTFGYRGEIWPTLFLGWTLNYEMFFYALFAACLCLRRGWRVPVLTALLVALVGAGRVVDPTGAGPRTWTSPLLLEFVAGMWLGVIAGARGDRFAAGRALQLMLAVALALAVASVAMPRLTFGAGATAIIAAALFVERRGWLPRFAPLKRLGDASYSIYLCQGFALEATTGALAMAAHRTGWPLDLVRVTAPLSFAAAIALGLGVSALIERPVTARLRRLGDRRYRARGRR